MWRAKKYVAAVTILLVWAGGAGASKDVEPTEAELAFLPPYCKDAKTTTRRSGNYLSLPSSQYWLKILGREFSHIHHYCRGLAAMQRAETARDKWTRTYYFRAVIGEINYVLERADAKFVLLPELYTQKGLATMRLKQGGDAVTLFEKALQLKADYWVPYAYLSDYYRDIGEREKARQVLTEGLRHVPDSKSLQRRARELAETAPTKKASGDKKKE